jgi:glycerophosphoryl diester phosphodiesterase
MDSVSMKNRRRPSVLLLSCLVALIVTLTAVPAEAKRGLNLHRGSRGPAVTLLESRLAALGLLTPSAVDRRYRIATVHAVRRLQFELGLRQTGRVRRAMSNVIAREPARRAAVRAPLVVGHRGAVTPGVAENTLQSMQYAAPVADLLEFDLQVTADHQLVLMHDPTLDRTTNCTGAVAAWTLADLQAQCRVADQPIPTFDQVAAFAEQTGKSIAPELKNGAMSTEDLQQVADVLTAHGLVARTWLQSYYGSALTRMHQLLPSLRTVLVSGGVASSAVVRSVGASALAAKLTALSIPRVRAYHRAGVVVWAWTARSTGEIQTVRGLGVNAVVTDVPRTARALFR